MNQFRDRPVSGIGAGSFDTTYFRERRTDENVERPHSIELQALAETGLVGAALLGFFLLGVVAGFLARARGRGSGRGPATSAPGWSPRRP